MSCCPPGSHGSLPSQGQSVGSEIKIGSVDVFAVGDVNNCNGAVLIVNDVFGWRGGRTRVIAERIAAANNYYVVVPKILQPCVEGGSDGDGLPPDFDFAKRADGMKILSAFPWEAVREPLLTVVNSLKESGVTKLSLFGFCWGGIPASEIASIAEYVDTSSGKPFVRSVVIGHPSLHALPIWGRNGIDLSSTVRAPSLWLPASNDPADYNEDGAWFLALKANNPESKTVRYDNMVHGWMTRGPLEDPEIAAAYNSAMEESIAFINKFM